jgi:antitoxin component of MazEF toxin-antitoxin module
MLSTEVVAQRLGRSSLVMTVPSIWTKSVGLQKGDPLRIEFLPDGSLRIFPLKDNQNGLGAPSTEAPTKDTPPVSKQEASSPR